MNNAAQCYFAMCYEKNHETKIHQWKGVQNAIRTIVIEIICKYLFIRYIQNRVSELL